ncbi:MAG: DUF4956 domain-containing protein [Ignavibacteriae bacterium]|nr:DUF4956 domain-containing protein [Ignavibacteriota bacterium]
MLQYFQGITVSALTVGDFVANLLVACLCGLLQVAFYRFAYRGPGYSVSFLNSLVLLAMITAMVIMVIGDSLARAFGLVGAMSIIRFRTAVKEVMDIVHIFLALAIGMTAGVGMHAAALFGTLLLGVVYVALVRNNVLTSSHDQYVIQFAYNAPPQQTNGHDLPYLSSLQKFCRYSKLVNVKSVGEGDVVEMSYHIKPKQKEGVSGLLKELKDMPGVRSVVVFSDEEQF